MAKHWKDYLPHLVALSGQLCFSGWHIVGSVALNDGADPIIFALYRELIGSAFMYAVIVHRGESVRIEREDYLRFFFLGACSFINVVGAVLALNYISATRFAIFQPAIPCISTVVSILLGLDRCTFLKLLGITLAVGGAVMAEAWKTSGDDDDDEKDVLLGTIIVSVQVLGMGLLMVFVKPMLAKYPSSAVTFAYYSLGTVLTLVMAAAWAFQFDASDLFFDGEAMPWVALGYAALFATAYTYNALSWAGQRLSPSALTVFSTFQPVGTILLSLVLLGDVVTLSEGLGAAAVIVGLLVAVYGAQRAGELGADAKQTSDGEEQGGGGLGHDALSPLADATVYSQLREEEDVF